MRNRIPHAIVMTVLCILLIMPWLTGMVFKHKYYHLIDIINQDQRLKIDILEYQEGWLESTAKIRITLTGNEFGNLPQIKFAHPVTFDLDETMFHGPIIYDTSHRILEVGYAKILTTMHLSEATENEVLGKLQSLGIMQIDVLSELDGDWRGHIIIPVLSLNIQNIGALSWAGLNGHFKLTLSDDHIKHINVDMKIGTFTMKGDDQNPAVRHVAIEPSEYEYNSTHENVGLWSGNSNLHSNGLYLVTQDGSYFSASNFNFNTKFGVSGGTFYNTNVAINIGNINATNNIIPMISDLHILVSADNFSAEDVLSYVNYFNSKMSQAQAIKIVNKSTIESLLVHTIRTTSELYSEISMKTTLGPITINSKSAWKENAPAPVTFDDVTMNSTTVMNVNASSTLVEQFLQFLTKKMHKPGQSSANDLNNDSFNQQLALYLKQGKITVNDFVAIVNLEKEKPSVTDFNEKLAQLNLPTDINSQLINLYGTYLNTLPPDGGNLKKPPQTPQQLIHDLLRIGYIQKDKDGNYFTTLTIEGGQIKINGSVINLK